MAKNVDLTSKEWRDLVFEGKNQEFGAHQLRKSSDKRHNLAMLYVLIGLAVVAAILFSLNMYNDYRAEIEAAEAKERAEKMSAAQLAQMEEVEEVEEEVEEDVDDEEITLDSLTKDDTLTDEDYEDTKIITKLSSILDEAYAAAKEFNENNDKNGANVLIEGLPGSGKTAIVET